MNLPFNIDLNNKVAAVTGGGGILCSGFSKVLAQCGAKVAVLDLRGENAQAVADEINKSGGEAIGISANVLDKESLLNAKKEINEKFGKIGILINGAGGNNPKGTTSKDYYEAGDETKEDVKTFFDLDPSGIEFVFNLNFLGTLLPTQVFAPDLIENKGSIINISSMNAFTPLTRIPAYSGAKAAVSNFTQACRSFFKGRDKSERDCARLLFDRPEQGSFNRRKWQLYRAFAENRKQYAYGTFRRDRRAFGHAFVAAL